MLRLTAMLVLMLLSLSVDADQTVRALIIFPANFGANSLFYLNNFRRLGWSLTTTGTADTMASCASFADPIGCPPIAVDVTLDEITDITAYDIVAIMSSSQNGTSPAQDLLQSQHALDLIHAAADSGLVVAAWCASVRVLAAADVLDGISVTGSPAYQAEYEAAGATFVGGNHYPVVDGTVVTCARGRYFHQENSNAVARALEGSPGCRRNSRGFNDDENDGADFTQKPRGESLWSTLLGGGANDVALGICPAAGGGFVAVGLTYAEGAGKSDLYLARLGTGGEVLWTRTYGGAGWDQGDAICRAQGGGYLIAGSTTSEGAGGRDLWLLKVDESGNELWSHTCGGPGMELATAVAEGSDGTVVALGYTESSGAGEDDLLLLKTDATGNEIWSRTMGSTYSEMGGAVAVTSDGGYIVASSTGGHGAANRDVWLLKLRNDGTEEWGRVYDGVSGAIEAAMDEGHAVIQTEDGGYVVAGVSDRPIPNSSGDLLCAFLVRTDPTGAELWRRRNGQNTLQDHARGLAYIDGILVTAGATTDPVTLRTDAFMVATDLDGTELWREIIGGDHPRWAHAIAAAPGVVGVAGYADSDSADRYGWVFALSTLMARFGAVPTSGHAPLSVQFTDQSIGPPTSWSWDLDGDGQTDSYEADPAWVYDSPGAYPVSLTIADGQSSASATMEGYVRVFDGESALEFNGHGGSAACAASPSLSFVEAVAVEALIAPGGWGESSALGYGRIVDKTSFALYVHGQGPTYNDHSLLFMIKNPTGTPKVYATPANSISLGQWQHVAVTYDSTAGVSMFIDGVSQELTHSGVASGPIRDNAGTDLIIGNASSDNVTFDGVLDEVRVWRIARAAHEIQRTIHRYLDGDEAGLVGYWRMNEGFGGVAYDGAQYGNDAVVAGARWAQGGLVVSSDPSGERTFHGGPRAFTLVGSAPNPFSGSTALTLCVDMPSSLEIAVFDIAGRRVRQIMHGDASAGSHRVIWDGRDEHGSPVSSGSYVWVARADDVRSSIPVVANR